MPSPDLFRLRLLAFRVGSFRTDGLTARFAMSEIARQNFGYHTFPRFRFRNRTRRRSCRLLLPKTITVRRFPFTAFRPLPFPKELRLPIIFGSESFELPSPAFADVSPKSRFPYRKVKTCEFPRAPFDAFSPHGVAYLSSISSISNPLVLIAVANLNALLRFRFRRQTSKNPCCLQHLSMLSLLTEMAFDSCSDNLYREAQKDNDYLEIR